MKRVKHIFSAIVACLMLATNMGCNGPKEIPDEDLDRFYRECPELERYRRLLTNMRRRRAHTLSPAEEKLLAAAGEMANAPDTIYGMFCDADISFPDCEDGEGKKHPLSQGTYISYMESPDRALRKSAFETLYRTYGSFKNTIASILNAQVKQLQFFAQARKYGSSLEASLDRTNVPVAVYKNLIEAVHQNMDKMHRYVRLRKKLLGVDELHFYDIYTPLVKDVDKKIPFADAKEAMAYQGQEMSAINSCMAIDLCIFKDFRYDENIFLDGVDHHFTCQMRQRGEGLQVFDYRCDHAFSGTEKPPKASALVRFGIYAKDYHYILRNDKSAYLRLVGKRALRLTLQYRSFAFLQKFCKAVICIQNSIRHF